MKIKHSIVVREIWYVIMDGETHKRKFAFESLDEAIAELANGNPDDYLMKEFEITERRAI